MSSSQGQRRRGLGALPGGPKRDRAGVRARSGGHPQSHSLAPDRRRGGSHHLRPTVPGRHCFAPVVQVAGTLFFNVSTFHALQSGLDTSEYNRLVGTPDALGSICFLVSGYSATSRSAALSPAARAARADGGSPRSTFSAGSPSASPRSRATSFPPPAAPRPGRGELVHGARCPLPPDSLPASPARERG